MSAKLYSSISLSTPLVYWFLGKERDRGTVIHRKWGRDGDTHANKRHRGYTGTCTETEWETQTGPIRGGSRGTLPRGPVLWQGPGRDPELCKKTKTLLKDIRNWLKKQEK